ncbi:alpha/beta hydrolase [Rhodococcus pyridinivorans]|uniref:alpha/beta hydrolase n=1 Tax=Rhodococcus pyridinivorans TaxID=103816 RepID=UPI0022836B1A|nr:alpha/beta hydrolase [Rhodococcus pyridinivorans]WAL49306.1 alpha/beta hydrolase [Rhodococcus pyridinivorans]
MALDQDAQQVLAQLGQAVPGGLHKVPLDQLRSIWDEMAAAGSPGPEVAKTEDRVLEGPRGDIPIRTYWPTDDEHLPVLVWFHGGAFAFGSIDAADSTCRELAVTSGAAVVSVGYRLAPENKFPAGVEDCFAVVEWIGKNGAILGLDSDRIAVGGDSSGATLAAVVSQMWRDSIGPRLAFQLLVYPTTLMRVSSYEYVSDPVVPVGMTNHFWGLYVEEDADFASPLCAPLNATDLTELPPAFVIIPEEDSTRADQERYAAELASAGVLTTAKVYPGTPHGFFTLAGAIEKGREAVDDAGRALKAAFAASKSCTNSGLA